jgi:hypothetical protein
MLRVVERFGVASSYVARVFTELRVPRPAQGYWARREFGKEPPRPPLPPALGASKAFIVTSAYLTSGAIKRIQRDQYVLGKVDRSDLDAWIESVLRARHGAMFGFH